MCRGETKAGFSRGYHNLKGLDKGLQEGLPHSACSDATIIRRGLRCVVGVPTCELQEVPDSPGTVSLGKKK